jgi:hypothetical protein
MPRRTFASQEELQDYAARSADWKALPSVSGCSRRINTRSSMYARRVSSEAGHTHPEGAEAPFRKALGIKSERKRWGRSGRPSKAASEICNRAQMSSSFINARSTTRAARCGVCASRMLCVGGTHAHPLRHSFCATGSGSFSCGQIFGPFLGSLGKEFIILRDQKHHRLG